MTRAWLWVRQHPSPCVTAALFAYCVLDIGNLVSSKSVAFSVASGFFLACWLLALGREAVCPTQTWTRWAKALVVSAFLVVSLGVGSALLPGCAPLLNPDPKTGGACRNGDQLGTPCGDGSCAPAGYRCAYDGRGWEIDEGQIGPGDVGGGFGAKAHDAGGE